MYVKSNYGRRLWIVFFICFRRKPEFFKIRATYSTPLHCFFCCFFSHFLLERHDSASIFYICLKILTSIHKERVFTLCSISLFLFPLIPVYTYAGLYLISHAQCKVWSLFVHNATTTWVLCQPFSKGSTNRIHCSKMIKYIVRVCIKPLWSYKASMYLQPPNLKEKCKVTTFVPDNAMFNLNY